MRSTLLALVFVTWPLTAEAAPPTTEQIQEWARALDSPKFKVRDDAARKLFEAGPDAAASLARTAKTGSAEASDRALRILGNMADGNDLKAETAARRHLRRLAEGESSVAGQARSLLNRKRNRLLAQLSFAGATYDLDDREGLRNLDLDEVSDLDSVLPLLKNFPEIEYISLSNKRFTDAGAVHLKELPNLNYLNLYQSNIGDEGLKQLTGLKNLRTIPMGETRVTDAGLKIVSGMTQLEYVGVRGNNVTDAGLVHLKNLTNLTGLYLGETKVTDVGLKHLAPLTKLRYLNLHTTGITDVGLEHLTEFKDLRRLYLGMTKTTSAGKKKLQEALPELDISDEKRN